MDVDMVVANKTQDGSYGILITGRLGLLYGVVFHRKSWP